MSVVTRSAGVRCRANNENDNERCVDHRPKDEHQVLEKPSEPGGVTDAEDVRPAFPLEMRRSLPDMSLAVGHRRHTNNNGLLTLSQISL
jgi:hypothetical protein